MTKPKSKLPSERTPAGRIPMLRLATEREPFWLDIVPGVRAQFRPISVAAILLARTAAADVLRAGGKEAMVKGGVAAAEAVRHLIAFGHRRMGRHRGC